MAENKRKKIDWIIEYGRKALDSVRALPAWHDVPVRSRAIFIGITALFVLGYGLLCAVAGLLSAVIGTGLRGPLKSYGSIYGVVGVLLLGCLGVTFSLIRRWRGLGRPVGKQEEFDWKSRSLFLGRCEKASRGVFFNVQIDMEEWFHPFAQVHLALQDAASRYIQLGVASELVRTRGVVTKASVHNHRASTSECPGDVNDIALQQWLMPFSRVLFLPRTKAELFQNLQREDGSYRNLFPFVDIHQMMACPLAVVCTEQLKHDIVIENRDGLFSDPRVGELLGLGDETVKQLKLNDPANTHAGLKELSKALEGLADIPDGKLVPTCDFALLYFARGGEEKQGEIEIWQAARNTNGRWEYFELSEQSIENLVCKRDFEVSWLQDIEKIRRDGKLTDGEQGYLNDLRETIVKFGQLVEKSVFKCCPSSELEGGTESSLNPVLRLLNEGCDSLPGYVTYADKQYHPRPIEIKVRDAGADGYAPGSQ